MSTAQHTPLYRVRYVLSRLGEDRYVIHCSTNGGNFVTERGPNGRVRYFHSEAAARAAIAKATGGAS